MRWRTYLELGRVSNLPTVWTNALAGAVLAGGVVTPQALAAPLLAGTLFYVGGMFLNDAFDREIDRRERADRPIPTGRISAGEVFGAGFGLLAAGWLLLLAQVEAWGYGSRRALLAGAALAGAIVLYNSWHKGNPLGPVLMGICRALLYLTAGLAVAE
ncbi:MAG: UbiA family prenyltransferase, partial [Gemmatimonadetes bacterium]|nr:UbiA family prenyltransferase [Gemmatimonadota bacterium]